MATIRWLLSDTHLQMPTIKFLLSCQHLTEEWLSCSDVIQGLLPKPCSPIWQCWGICVIRIWSLHTYRMLTKCKQDPYLTKWWQPKTKPHVTIDAYICLLSRLSVAFLLSDARCLLSDANYQMPAHYQIPTIRFLLSDAYYQQKHGLITLSRNVTLTRQPQRS